MATLHAEKQQLVDKLAQEAACAATLGTEADSLRHGANPPHPARILTPILTLCLHPLTGFALCLTLLCLTFMLTLTLILAYPHPAKGARSRPKSARSLSCSKSRCGYLHSSRRSPSQQAVLVRQRVRAIPWVIRRGGRRSTRLILCVERARSPLRRSQCGRLPRRATTKQALTPIEATQVPSRGASGRTSSIFTDAALMRPCEGGMQAAMLRARQAEPRLEGSTDHRIDDNK